MQGAVNAIFIPRLMADIIRIIIKGEFGYGPVDEAYSDKVAIDRDSIRYEYEPVVESNINVLRNEEICFVASKLRSVFPGLSFTRVSYCAGILTLER